MNVLDGLVWFSDPVVWGCLGVGILLGMLVGAFPGITATMAVALAAGFTMTLEPVQGLAVLLAIYVAAQFGDRIPSILVNTPGTPASIATTLDGYPLAKKGRAGAALLISALVTTVGLLASIVLLMVAAVPIATLAMQFGPAEMFALVTFGLAIMISISSKSLVKGLIAGALGLALGAVGQDPMTADPRFTLGILELTSGLNFLAVIVGLFGVAELLDQILQGESGRVVPSKNVGSWAFTKAEARSLVKPTMVGTGVGLGVGLVPAAGGDIAGLIGWDRARALSKHGDQFGKGSIEGLAAADSASSATIGGSVTTTMALGIPGDTVMAVMIGSMIIWGIQPGPSLFATRPDLVGAICIILILATIITTVLSLVRTSFMVKLLALDPAHLRVVILVFCMIGTYATTNSISTVITMMIFGVVGLVLKRAGFPAGPVVLGLLLGPLAESNLRRALQIDTLPDMLSRPITAALLIFAAVSIALPVIRSLWASARARRSSTKTLEHTSGSSR